MKEVKKMENNSNFEAFELSCWKKFKRKIKQVNNAGWDMTSKQRIDCLKFIETAYVNASHKVKGELSWDRWGHETYHRPFYLAPIDEEDGNFIELAWADEVEQLAVVE
jgi:hypothetical protein